jgi:hypothetical protein
VTVRRFRPLVIILVVCLAAALAAGQTARTAPRTPDGQPDLQGFWTNSTITPLERPKELTGKQFFTQAEALEYQKRMAQPSGEGAPGLQAGSSINDFWFERGKVVEGLRTSLIVDPPDGRIPAYTPEAQKRVAARAQERRLHPSDGPEDRSLAEQCIVWPVSGPPMMPTGYNSNYQIIQAPGYVVILVEMIHDARIIPLDGRPHVSSGIHEWMGDSRGHWDGNTLVVDTTNFSAKTGFRGAGENLHVTERFTRVDAETLRYEFTVDDSATFTKPWTAEIPMRRTQGPIYEYACSEGNYALGDILAGARTDEKKGSSK